MNSKPLVSVIMPAYNAGRFIATSIKSILTQTHSNLELIVIDDGSEDATVEVVRSISDARIQLVKLAENRGLSNVRNVGLAHASGEFIAWLDADDVALPRRIQRQLSFLTSNVDIGLCGTWVQSFGSGSNSIWRYPRNPAYLKAHLLFDDPFATSSVMMRRATVASLPEVFSVRFQTAEDYDLWERLSRSWILATVPEVLTCYRIHGSQTSTQRASEHQRAVHDIQGRQLARLGVFPSESERRIHDALGIHWGSGLHASDQRLVQEWLSRLRSANQETRQYPESVFVSLLRQKARLAAQALHGTRLRRLAIRLHTAIH